jgi:hypothetical protein
MPCTTEEECRRQKIIIDSQVAAMANRGIRSAARGELALEQLQRLIVIDEQYLIDTAEIAPELAEAED